MKEKLLEENENIITKEKSDAYNPEENEKEEKIEEIKTDTDEYSDSNKNLEQLVNTKNKKKNYNKILFYYEFCISIFLLINSFISFCFLNILHLLYSYLFIYNMYSTNYSFRIILEKYVSIGIIALDEIYLIFKGAIHLYMDSKKEDSNYDNNLFKFMNIYEKNWRTVYDYVMNSIIVIMLIINLIFKGYDQKYFDLYELNENLNSVERHMKNNSNILIIGVILLSLGSSCCPSLINLIILIFCFVFFLSRIFNKKMKKLTKKYLKYFFLIIIVLSTLYNYIFSHDMILEKFSENNNLSYIYGITKIFDNENNHITLNISAIFNFILFYISFFFINLHTKCINYINSSQSNRINFSSVSLFEKDLEPLKSENEKGKEKNFIF